MYGSTEVHLYNIGHFTEVFTEVGWFFIHLSSNRGLPYNTEVFTEVPTIGLGDFRKPLSFFNHRLRKSLEAEPKSNKLPVLSYFSLRFLHLPSSLKSFLLGLLIG